MYKQFKQQNSNQSQVVGSNQNNIYSKRGKNIALPAIPAAGTIVKWIGRGLLVKAAVNQYASAAGANQGSAGTIPWGLIENRKILGVAEKEWNNKMGSNRSGVKNTLLKKQRYNHIFSTTRFKYQIDFYTDNNKITGIDLNAQTDRNSFWGSSKSYSLDSVEIEERSGGRVYIKLDYTATEWGILNTTSFSGSFEAVLNPDGSSEFINQTW